MILRAAGLVAAVLAFAGDAALAQSMTAYQSGLGVAERRGYANAGCYAEVFARHADLIERPDGRRSWYATSTPAYNAEQRRRCGVDRLGDLAARQQPRSDGFAARGGSGNVQDVGMRVAAQRGYHGATAACFARTYAVFASLHPHPDGRPRYAIPGRSMNSYTGELFRACGVSR